MDHTTPRASTAPRQLADLFHLALTFLAPDNIQDFAQIAGLAHEALTLAEHAWKRLTDQETDDARALMPPATSQQIDLILTRYHKSFLADGRLAIHATPHIQTNHAR